MSEIVVRYPPSPTGPLHVGTIRTVLYNYLFAKKQGGRIVMRLEDTDTERSTKEFEENILSGIQNLGLSWDGEVQYQSARTAVYRKHLEQILSTGRAYYCFCSKEELEAERKKREAAKLPPRYSGKCAHLSVHEQQEKIATGASAVIRFRTPSESEIKFCDHVRGEVVINTRDLDDFVIAKNLKSPLYNFCVVVDDFKMGISHIIRGEDHIPNTPKQILIYEAFGWQIPQFAHLPLILNQDRSKLSKRRNKVSVDDYLAEGYLPEALLNFLALLGWNTADEQEIFSLEELIEKFSLDRVHKGGAIFDLEKLLWLNGMWIRKKSPDEFAQLAEPYLQDPIFTEGRKKYGEKFYAIALESVHERCKKLNELPDFLKFFFVETLDYSSELYLQRKMKVDTHSALEALQKSIPILEAIAEADWNHDVLKDTLFQAVQDLGWKNGQLLWPLRVALSGEQFSPGTFELLEIFGKERSLERIFQGIKILSATE